MLSPITPFIMNECVNVYSCVGGFRESYINNLLIGAFSGYLLKAWLKRRG